MAPHRTDTPLPGRYRTIRRLGSGGMATVFLAEDQRLGRRVAVKRLHADSPEEVARRFEREAKLGASLNHPNIVSVYDIATDDEGVLIVMEYVAGESLRQALTHGRLGTDPALGVIRAVAAALDHAHSNGVVHRDVKPANVLFGGGGTVKLVDLGIATAAESTRLTASGTVLGTPAYMAPEQLEAGRRIGPEADIYALGAVAYELLSGRKARPGETPFQIAHRAVSEPPPDVREAWPEAPDAAADALHRAMCRDPDGRPASAGELALELTEAMESHTVAVHAAEKTMVMPARATGPPADVPRRPAAVGPAGIATRVPATARRRRPWGVIAAAAAVIVVIAAIALLVTGGDDQRAPPSLQAATSDEANGPPGSDRDRASSDAVTGDSGEGPSEVTGGTSQAPTGVPAASGVDDPVLGTQLNDQGKRLLDGGQPQEAVPVLERSVSAFPEGTSDVNYAYALFNLGQALRESGRPGEAIPVLERRLEFKDQRAVVRRELDLARSEAGAE